jgi:hypothetical protein
MTGEMNTSETGTNDADCGSVVEIEGRYRKTDGGIMNRSSTAPDSKLKAKRIKVTA